MKADSYRLENPSSNVYSLFVDATDKMKQPVQISVTVQPRTGQGGPVFVGKREDLADLMRIFARIAWNEFKWRPAALIGTFAQLVEKIRV